MTIEGIDARMLYTRINPKPKQHPAENLDIDFTGKVKITGSPSQIIVSMSGLF